VRGWLDSINGEDHNEILTFNYYGSLSSMQWTTLSGTRNYNLLYDKLNRLINADYTEALLPSMVVNNDRYNMENMTYDRNGNIKTMRRYGWTGSPFNMIDDLAYTCDGNQLLTVADASNNDLSGRGDFYELYANGTGDGDEFDYDTNGNMTKDENNNQKFSYNILNLPDLMYYNTGSYPYVDYMYDANGKKLKEYYLYGPGNSKTIDYIGPFVYEQAQGGVNFILTPEGRAKNTGSTYSYEYFLKDHLGNTAVVVNQSGTVVQEKHYYPYGMTFGGTGLASNTNRFLYTGKESQTEINFNLIDFGARMFNPALAVWTTADPMAQYHSPYVYCGDDPMNRIDPTGMWGGKRGNKGKDEEPTPRDGGPWQQWQLFLEMTGFRNHSHWSDAYTGKSFWNPGITYGEWEQAQAMTKFELGKKLSNITYSGGEWNQFTSDLSDYIKTGKWGKVITEPLIQVPYILAGIENTEGAFQHYFNGNGSPITLGNNTIDALILSKKFQLKHQRIISGKTISMSGDFSVDLTFSVLHVGNTNVDYSIKCTSESCIVTYTLFVRDGFWDVDYIDEYSLGKLGVPQLQPDGLGPNLERFGGTPYPYNPIIGTCTFPNPGY